MDEAWPPWHQAGETRKDRAEATLEPRWPGEPVEKQEGAYDKFLASDGHGA